MIVAARVRPEDNDSYMITGVETPGLKKCSKCGLSLDDRYVNPAFVLAKKKFDLTETDDGWLIASEKLKKFCQGNEYKGLHFAPLPGRKDFFALFLDSVLPVDIQRSEIESTGKCTQCGQYDEVAGGTPVYLKGVTQPVAEGFHRSDLKLGSQTLRGYILFVGRETRKSILKEKLKGLFFEDVEA